MSWRWHRYAEKAIDYFDRAEKAEKYNMPGASNYFLDQARQARQSYLHYEAIYARETKEQNCDEDMTIGTDHAHCSTSGK